MSVSSYSSITAFSGLFLLALAASSAQAGIASGQNCSQLGVSQMSDSQEEIVTCLKNRKGKLIWKSASVNGVPVGSIIIWPFATNPPDMQNADGSYNWLDCNGQGISSADYPELYAMLGARVPDFRGQFLRGGTAAQTMQVVQDSIKSHNHQYTAPSSSGGGGKYITVAGQAQMWVTDNNDGSSYCGWYFGSDPSGGMSCSTGYISSGSVSTYTANTSNTGDTETAPKHTYIRYLIRAQH